MSTAGSAPQGAVIVLTGPPGAGKTTVARLIADTLTPSVHLPGDDFWHFIRQGRIGPYRPEANRQNAIVINALARCAFEYAAGDYRVICDGIVGPWFVDIFRTAAADIGIPLHYVVLRPDAPTALHRATTRSVNAIANPDLVSSLCEQFADLGMLEPHTVDSTGHTAASTAATILAGLAQGDYRLDPAQ